MIKADSRAGRLITALARTDPYFVRKYEPHTTGRGALLGALARVGETDHVRRGQRQRSSAPKQPGPTDDGGWHLAATLVDVIENGGRYRWRPTIISIGALTVAMGLFTVSGGDARDPSLEKPTANSTTRFVPMPSTPPSDPRRQAAAVDALLSQMSLTRSGLEDVTFLCSKRSVNSKTFTTAIRARQQEKAKAQKLDTAGLDQGTELRKLLVRALETAIDFDLAARDLLQSKTCVANPESRLRRVDTATSNAKDAFLSRWNPLATSMGLSPRTRESI